MHLTKCLNFTGKHLNSSALVVLHQKQCLSWELPLLNQQGILTTVYSLAWLPYQSCSFLSSVQNLYSVKLLANYRDLVHEQCLSNVLAWPLNVSVWVIGRKQKGAEMRRKNPQTEHFLLSREVIFSIRLLFAKLCRCLTSTLSKEGPKIITLSKNLV